MMSATIAVARVESCAKKIGAPRETRTPTSLRTTDFESAASTGSATGAMAAYPSLPVGAVNGETRPRLEGLHAPGLRRLIGAKRSQRLLGSGGARHV